MALCGCGCGKETRIGIKTGTPNKFINGHHNRIRTATRKGWTDYPPPIEDAGTGCHRWQGPKHSAGYGLIGGHTYAHRVAYETYIGPISDGHDIDHVAARGCRYRDCVNPAHLEAVTHKVNVQRSERVADQMARTHCPQGHEYSGHNLIVRRGKRECRTCVYERNARNRERRRRE